MKIQARFTPTLIKIALPFYLIVGIALMTISSVKGIEVSPFSSPSAPAAEMLETVNTAALEPEQEHS